MPQPPPVLYVLSPNGQQKSAGEYALVNNEQANGQPFWRQVGGSFWLYSGNNGMWILGAKEAKDKSFQCSHGVIFCKVLHAGQTPDKLVGSWWRLDGDAFVEDEDIRINTGISRPFSLRIVSPNGQERCAGEYQLVGEQTANGQPVWQQKHGKCWLYSGSTGMWIIGSSDAKEKDFNCARGLIHSKRAHGGLMPDRVGCAWMRLEGDRFREDPSITVTIKPPPLYVQSPNGQQRCAGEYLPVADQMANGQPLWVHISGKCWLYSGINGMWIIGGADAKEKDFQCTRGVIYCRTPHQGMPPDKLVGNWLRLDGEGFREDAAISVSVKPSTLHVVSPNGQQRCAGEYRLVAGEVANGQAVWKQRKGIFRIFSSPAGCWMVGGNEAKEAEFLTGTIALQTDVQHKGMMPDKMGSVWFRLDGENYVEDSLIKVASSLKKPAELHVKSPNGQQKCAGQYVLVANTTANGQPLWRQMGGKFWLYSGTNGMWIFGSSSAKEKNFDCSRGVIYSNTPHGGVMPDKLKSLWLRLDGEAFHEDASITVEPDFTGSRKRKTPAP